MPHHEVVSGAPGGICPVFWHIPVKPKVMSDYDRGFIEGADRTAEVWKAAPDKTHCPTCGGEGKKWIEATPWFSGHHRKCQVCHGIAIAPTAEQSDYTPEEYARIAKTLDYTPPDEQSFEQIVAEALELLPENVAAILAAHNQAIDQAIREETDRVLSMIEAGWETTEIKAALENAGQKEKDYD